MAGVGKRYSNDLAADMNAFIDGHIEESEPLTLEALNARSAPVKVRDGLVRLFSPYL